MTIERDMLRSAETVTMYAVCVYYDLLERVLWYDFTLEVLRNDVTHTQDAGTAHKIAASIPGSRIVCVELEGHNAHFI